MGDPLINKLGGLLILWCDTNSDCDNDCEIGKYDSSQYDSSQYDSSQAFYIDY